VNRRHLLATVVSFFAGIAVAFLGPRLIHAAAARLLFPENRTEIARIPSPDGMVDAVAQRTNCGAPCSSSYVVSIVPKGAIAPRDSEKQVFLADDIVNAQVRWKEPHLLDIGYDKAFIENFRNVTYPLGSPGDVESWHYAVEVHLSPSSAGFSYLGDSTGP
jgi:hypothetical protein